MSSLFEKLRTLLGATVRGSHEYEEDQTKQGNADSAEASAPAAEVTEAARDRDALPEVTEAPLSQGTPRQSDDQDASRLVQDEGKTYEGSHAPQENEEDDALQGDRVVDLLKDQG